MEDECKKCEEEGMHEMEDGTYMCTDCYSGYVDYCHERFEDR